MKHPFAFRIGDGLLGQDKQLRLMLGDAELNSMPIRGPEDVDSAKRTLAYWLLDRAEKLAKEMGVAR